MKTIPLTQGQVALVDDEDFDRVNQHKWCAVKIGRGYYAARKVEGRLFLLHWFITGEKGIDHRDGQGLNNQKENLRNATQQQNLCGHRRKAVGATSKYRGVSWDERRQSWLSQIQVGGRQTHLGRFDLEANAARAYDSAALEHFGEFACPNFP